MDPTLRRAFNDAFTPALRQRYRAALERRVGDIPFRLAETPVFLPVDLWDTLDRTTRAILAQLSEPARIARMRAAVPARFDVPRQDALPHCAQVDLAVVRDADGRLGASVVELQGFPSLYAFELAQAAAWREALAPEMPVAPTLASWFDGLDEARAVERLREVVVAGEDAAHVVLLDLAPHAQKTRPDFVATHAMLGVEPVDPRDLVREGRTLFRGVGGARVPVRRIFNRIVFDELEKQDVKLPFAYTDDLDVAWVPHPNWYWVWSKYSLLHLDHPAVPETRRLSDVTSLPADLATGWVLKPLFSFAGGGVKVEPTPADVAAIPLADRDGWLLQRKVAYARELLTPAGDGVAVEVRVMCLRADGERELRPAWTLVRLSRGKMHGVDHNRDMEFTGSTVALRAPG